MTISSAAFISTAAATTGVSTLAHGIYSRNGIFNYFVTRNLKEEIDNHPDMEHFNGLDTIGGDVTKWRDAKDALLENLDDRLMMEKACVIVLEKPSGVLFSGLTGEEKKVFRQLANLKDTADNNVQNTFKMTEPMFIAAQNKDDIVKNVATQLSPFVTKDGNGDIEPLVAEEINEDFLIAVNQEIIQSQDKYMLLGSHYNNIKRSSLVSLMEKGKLTRLHDEIARYLPKMTQSELAQMDENSLKKMRRTRSTWPNVFKDINVSRCKRIGLLSLQLRTVLPKAHQDWRKKYNGLPLNAKLPAKINEKTKEIWTKQIEEFREDRKYWDTWEFWLAFNKTPKEPLPKVPSSLGLIPPFVPIDDTPPNAEDLTPNSPGRNPNQGRLNIANILGRRSSDSLEGSDPLDMKPAAKLKEDRDSKQKGIFDLAGLEVKKGKKLTQQECEEWRKNYGERYGPKKEGVEENKDEDNDDNMGSNTVDEDDLDGDNE